MYAVSAPERLKRCITEGGEHFEQKISSVVCNIKCTEPLNQCLVTNSQPCTKLGTLFYKIYFTVLDQRNLTRREQNPNFT